MNGPLARSTHIQTVGNCLIQGTLDTQSVATVLSSTILERRRGCSEFQLLVQQLFRVRPAFNKTAITALQVRYRILFTVPRQHVVLYSNSNLMKCSCAYPVGKQGFSPEKTTGFANRIFQKLQRTVGKRCCERKYTFSC